MSARIESLAASDLQTHPVWQLEDGGVHVKPVKRWPVESLLGKLVGTRVRLANGSEVWAILGNLSPRNPRSTQHFLTASIERDGKWFALARYHDFDAAARGPEALASFLGLAVADVFPISYDVRRYAKGDPAALAGTIEREPRERLNRAEIIALAVPRPGDL
jgi:hypothetical protein